MRDKKSNKKKKKAWRKNRNENSAIAVKKNVPQRMDSKSKLQLDSSKNYGFGIDKKTASPVYFDSLQRNSRPFWLPVGINRMRSHHLH
jgi:hypothetical protein